MGADLSIAMSRDDGGVVSVRGGGQGYRGGCQGTSCLELTPRYQKDLLVTTSTRLERDSMRVGESKGQTGPTFLELFGKSHRWTEHAMHRALSDQPCKINKRLQIRTYMYALIAES